MPGRREVFYAAYGSNLSAQRFACYIAGGAAPGSDHVHRGSRDRRLPESWRALRVPGILYFAGHSMAWGGAPAFYAPPAPDAEHAGETLVRAWRIGWDQLEDVMAQENRRPTHPLELDPAALVEGYAVLAGPGRYDRLVCVGIIEDLPVVTFTAPESPEPPTPAAPAAAYLAHIIAGLREAFALDDEALVDYVGRAPGATPDLVRVALTEM